MNVHVLYFAVFRERLRSPGEDVALPADADVAALLAALEARHPPVAALRGRYRVAVNEAFVDDAHRLAEGDEVALVPPVAGGAGRYAVVLDAPLSLDRVVTAVRSATAGGLVTFSGMVRDHSHGARIERLEYEAYRPMAERVMARLCDEIEAELPGTTLAVEHRVGVLAVGELAVVIAAAAPHRAEAFAACRALIDRLKEHAPIWKKEIGEHGQEWVGLGP